MNIATTTTAMTLAQNSQNLELSHQSLGMNMMICTNETMNNGEYYEISPGVFIWRNTDDLRLTRDEMIQKITETLGGFESMIQALIKMQATNL